MKEQRMIVKHSHLAFLQDVNEMLAEGWMVVPGTLQTSAAATDNRTEYVLAVVLEREKKS